MSSLRNVSYLGLLSIWPALWSSCVPMIRQRRKQESRDRAAVADRGLTVEPFGLGYDLRQFFEWHRYHAPDTHS